MPIISSIVVTDMVQSGGQRRIREEHTGNLGVKHYRQFVVASSYNEVNAQTELDAYSPFFVDGAKA